jgi:hypothetical protein
LGLSVSTLRLARNARSTSVVQVAQAGVRAKTTSSPLQSAPSRVFTAADIATPEKLAKLLTDMQRDVTSVTRASRSNPMNGGIIFSNMQISTTPSNPTIVWHNMQRPYRGYLVVRCYQATASIVLFESPLPNGLPASVAVALAANSNVPLDLWVF